MDRETFNLLKELAAIIGEHGFDSNGICRNPGRYEGEPIETIYYDRMEIEAEEFGDQSNDTLHRVFEASPAEKAIFSPGEGEDWYVIQYTDYGFLNGEWMTDAQLNALRNRVDEIDSRGDLT